ncbi:phage tail fiber protein [Acinetobacter ursingii]|uniref:phage tail fiber protein n=1 Tax=Acinetobacter ursingii TaxID=108980 RepID=UPI003009B010
MAIQTINIGNNANDGAGDPARSAFNKINQNFTNPAHAASRMVGLEAGNVMQVGAFGLGGSILDIEFSQEDTEPSKFQSGFYYPKGGMITGTSSWGDVGMTQGVYTPAIIRCSYRADVNTGFEFGIIPYTNQVWFRSSNRELRKWLTPVEFRTTGNTWVDANGFIKQASPIVKLFADKIELNDEASEQQITFEKIDVGHYLIKGSSGFAQEGWYIETPKDANGNILFAVNYEQLENGDIEVKTYKKKFDLESASIVADLENPVDITLNRWIDIRLQEVPKPVPVMPTEEVNSDEPQQ